jgi:hypothetical protein
MATPKFIAIDEETNHQIVHRCRFGKTNRATHQTLDPSAHSDVFALDGLRVLFPDYVLLRGNMSFVGTPSIGREAGDVKRCQELLQLEKHPSADCPAGRQGNVWILHESLP